MSSGEFPPLSPLPYCMTTVGLQICKPHRLTKRWTTILSSEVNMPHEINFRTLCGASSVTLRSNFVPKKPSRSSSYESRYVPLEPRGCLDMVIITLEELVAIFSEARSLLRSISVFGVGVYDCSWASE